MTLLQHEFLPTKSYTFQTVRYMLQGMGIQPGCTLGGDFLPSQRGAGANLSIDVAAGNAWVLGQGVARQGMYHVTNDATFNVAPFTAGDGTNPRIDQVILVANDTSIAGASDAPQLVIVNGVATAGATLVNRNGAVSDATLTSTYKAWMRVCDVLMPVSAASVTTANIKERRPKIGGKTNISTTEARTNTAYGPMATADQVNELVVPADGLIAVLFQGAWQQSNASTAFASLFVGTNQLKGADTVASSPLVTDTILGNPINQDNVLVSNPGGLISFSTNLANYTGDVTTGQVIGSRSGNGGVCFIFVAAGTYDISLQTRSTAGSVTMKNRKLWVWVEDPFDGVIG